MADMMQQLEAMNLSPDEIRQLMEQMLVREQKRAREQAVVVADLLVSTLRVAAYSNPKLVQDAEAIHKAIRTLEEK